MKKRMKSVIIVAVLLLPTLLQAQSLDTVIVKQLRTGWNLVGYMGQTSEQTQDAFAGIMDKVEIIKSLDGFYNPEQQAFLNSLDTLLPLDGLMIKVSEDCILERTIKKSAILYHDTETQSLSDVVAIGNSANGQIKEVSDPTDPQDAVNKAYVTLRVSAIGDTLFLGNSQYVIIPGISDANPVESGTCIFTDERDGNVYTCVTIGNQVWMAENLKYLPSVVASGTGSETMPYYYVYDYDGNNVAVAKATSNYSIYGVLYNWTAAMNEATSSNTNPSGVQGVCPVGWHVPSYLEWIELENYLVNNGYNYDGTTGGEGDKIAKSLASTSGWETSTIAGAVGNTDYSTYRNKSGFTALPGGYRHGSGVFGTIGYAGYWWGASQGTASSAVPMIILNLDSNVYRDISNKALGFSVRCVRD